jgi:hypothetical protein
MLKRTELQDVCFAWIQELKPGKTFEPADLYRLLQTKYPDECGERGDSSYEERYRNDARWAVKRALGQGLTSQIRRGLYQRNS